MRKECVYEEEWERIQRLQGTIEKLEQKLQRLQNASASSPSKGKKSASTRPDRSGVYLSQRWLVPLSSHCAAVGLFPSTQRRNPRPLCVFRCLYALLSKSCDP